MSHLLILLVVFVTTCFSGLLSPASGQFRFPARPGSDALFVFEPVPSGGALEVPFEAGISPLRLDCIQEEAPEADCGIGNETTLNSTNRGVAVVIEGDVCDGFLQCLDLRKPGSTTVELRDAASNEILAAFVLVVTPFPTPPQLIRPGTECELTELPGNPGRVDCSGTCVELSVAEQRLGDGVCDNGRPRDDGLPPIDLSCVFIPEFFRNDVLIRPFTNRTDRDGGDCDPKQSCEAQFGDAPDYEFCSGTSSFCSFNATTGGGTCAEMCQRFGSRCVAALDNNPAGCTPLPNSTDTCEMPRNSEICVCERR